MIETAECAGAFRPTPLLNTLAAGRLAGLACTASFEIRNPPEEPLTEAPRQPKSPGARRSDGRFLRLRGKRKVRAPRRYGAG